MLNDTNKIKRAIRNFIQGTCCDDGTFTFMVSNASSAYIALDLMEHYENSCNTEKAEYYRRELYERIATMAVMNHYND